MLRQLGLLATAVALVAAGCDDDDDNGTGPEPEVYSATLTGANEVPAVNTTAQGTATFTVDGNDIDYVVTITNWPAGRTVTAAHIHNPPTQTPGTGTVLLGWPTGSITTTGGSGTVTASDAQLATIRAGNTYFNVHSSANTGGEIRGNLVRQ
jgi:hypothetical protein